MQFKCQECTQYVNNQQALDAHTNLKHSRLHICNFCGSMYKQRSAVNEHIRIKYEKTAKAFDCHICAKTLCRFGQLQDHITPYRCQTCKRSFSNKSSCERHNRECSGKSRTTCDTCNRIFSSSTALMDHRDSEHLGKMYRCVCVETRTSGVPALPDTGRDAQQSKDEYEKHPSK